MPGGTLKGEFHRTAELLVDIADKQGVYFAISVLYDAGYDREMIKGLLPILQRQAGAIKKGVLK